jgi:hypothetical protein
MKKVFLRMVVAAYLSGGALGIVSLAGCGGDEPPPATGPAQDIDMGSDPEKYLEGERKIQ